MLPIIFSIGPLTIKSFYLFFSLAVFMAGFIFWRKGKEEYYEEDQLFDGFILSVVASMIFARVGFVILNIQNLGFNIVNWFDVVNHSGVSGLIGGIGGTLFLYKYAKDKKWDIFEILDFWVTGLSMGLALLWLGLFFDGSGFGFATNMPWGVVFPGVFEKHHPVQLYASLLFFVVYYYISRLEYRYRTFSWYIAKKKNAPTGFIFSVFLISLGLIELMLSLLTPSELVVNGLKLDWLIALATSVFGLLILFSRAGYLPSIKKNK